MYTIEVDYTTGNSFGHCDEMGTVGHCWEDKALARKALKSISEHYKLYSEKDGYGGRGNDEIENVVKGKEWFKNLSDPDIRYWKQSIAVEMDGGEWRNMSTGMWVGYFETLNEARVVNVDDENDEDRVSFW